MTHAHDGHVSTRDPKTFGRVGVLMGGLSAEHDISLMSGHGVLAALRSRGVDAHAFDPAERTLGDLAQARFDRVFVALHGRFGEDGAIQGALELMGIPYTGSGVMASAIAMDKIFTKRIWESQGLPTPRSVVLDARKADRADLHRVPDALGLPLIVKPPHEGSTIGISKVAGYSEMASAVSLAARFDDHVLVEEFVTGRELTVSIVERDGLCRALPIIEIVAPAGNYDYQNKYFTDDTRYLCPAPIDEALGARIRELALTAFAAIGGEGWGRVDFMLRDADSEPFLLEVNTSPGMTGHSLVPIAARAIGLSYEDLCVEILASARLKTRHAALKDAQPETGADVG
jgi:D-alanine-D-alanine ligase